MMQTVCLLAAGVFAAPEPAPLAGAVIVVDPGHGGQRYSKSYTGGTRGVDSKLTESELNLRVAVELAKCLQENGATVYMTRDSRPSAQPRRDRAARTNCTPASISSSITTSHFFLSVHHNAGGANATGHTTLYKHNAKDDSSTSRFATRISTTPWKGRSPGRKTIGR